MTPTRRFYAALLLPGALLAAACAHAPASPQPACPQPRATVQAPEPFYSRRNPLAAGGFDRERARRIFETNDGGGCTACHGKKGNGRGPLAAKLSLPPRDFTCRATMATIPDGQLFWIIRNGSPNTPMLSHGELSDEETWQVVMYIRTLAR